MDQGFALVLLYKSLHGHTPSDDKNSH